MALGIRIHHWPARLATGLFILNSGMSKRGADQQTAEGLHGMATTAYPVAEELEPKQFTELLSKAEVAVGTSLVAPVVPTWLAGTLLTGFASCLVGLYLRVPGMREEGSLRPTQDGQAIAKDFWMLGIGATFVLEALRDRRNGDD